MKSRIVAMVGGLLFCSAIFAVGVFAEEATVYFTHRVTPEAMVQLYRAIGRELSGNVAIKLHSGEGDGSNNLRPALIKPTVDLVGGTIVECNTAYGGNRMNTAMHLQILKDHGYADIAAVDIMDADGSMNIPVAKGTHLSEDLVGSHMSKYKSLLVLTHFKGHAMGGFGGSLKNISIGMASSSGKLFIHTAGSAKTGNFFKLAFATDQDSFVESMAEAASAISDWFGQENIVYINVMNQLSVDCDCVANPAAPVMGDVGMLASTDAVALDRACVDLVYAADRAQSASLIERMESRHGAVILSHAEAIGMGTQQYKLVSIDN